MGGTGLPIGKVSGKITGFQTAVVVQVVLFLLLSVESGKSQVEKQHASSPSVAQMEENGQDKKSSLTFMGVVEPGRLFRLILQPGETIQKLAVKEGQAVVEGQPLATLISDSLSAAKFDLLQKRQMLQKDKHLLELTTFEVTLKEQQLERIQQQIAEEKRLADQVEGYVPILSAQLERERQILTGELELLRAKMSKGKENEEQTKLLEEMLAQQLAQITARAAMLDVRAPFSGKATFVSPEGMRTPPGGIVCELWSDSVFHVRGKIMQHQIKYFRSGDKVEIALDFSDEKPVAGTIMRIQQSGGKIESQGGYPAFDVLVQVEGDVPWIQGGMLVSLKKSLSPQ